MRLPNVPSLTRWTSIHPLIALVGLWATVAGNLAGKAITASLKAPSHTELQELAKEAAATLADTGFRLSEGKRLRAAADFANFPGDGISLATAPACIIAAMACGPVQRMSYNILKWENIHHRQPMFLDRVEISFWLKDKQKVSSSSLLERIKSHPVSKYVNSPMNNDQRCILEAHMEQ